MNNINNDYLLIERKTLGPLDPTEIIRARNLRRDIPFIFQFPSLVSINVDGHANTRLNMIRMDVSNLILSKR